jgi:hypothetical protein
VTEEDNIAFATLPQAGPAGGKIRHSDQLAQLGAALALAQNEIEAASKDSLNPHFKSRYADLASVWEACRKALCKNGLAVLQPISGDGSQRVTVTTILLHKSGEWIAGDLTLAAAQATPQAIGSAITYGRRYGLAAMVGVAPDDDDGEAAEGRGEQQPGQPTRPPTPQRAAPGGARTITEAQSKRLWAIAREHGRSNDDVKALLEIYGFASTRDITVEKYDEIVTALQKPK